MLSSTNSANSKTPNLMVIGGERAKCARYAFKKAVQKLNGFFYVLDCEHPLFERERNINLPHVAIMVYAE